MNLIDIKVPDIGDFSDVPVIELYVKPGDAIAVDDAIAMLESDKATMDVPSTAAGIVREVCVKLGDRVGEGSLLIRVEAADTASAPAQPQPAASAAAGANGQSPLQQQTPPQESAPAVADVKVPDIGDFTDVPVIELYVKPGDAIAVDNAIAMLESDKATMDVPSTVAGIVQEVCVKLGDKVSEGSLLIRVETVGTTSTEATPSPNSVRPEPVEGKNGVMTQNLPEPSAVHASTSSARTEEALSVAPSSLSLGGLVHASPSVRAYARELGADLARIAPTGPKGRILKEDVTAFVKRSLQNPVAAAPASLGGGL
ncbi:MAG: E3 binding domain-containing protein, partial [Zoogloeaceae bacterium]|nr:E3 binding domain-containing protein [Zoogloeaceae bacterium]